MLRFLSLRLCSVLCLLLVSSIGHAASVVRTAEFTAPSADSARLVLQISQPPREKLSTLDNPYRVVLDLPNTQWPKGLKVPSGSGPVSAMRTGVRGGTGLRIVLELSKSLPTKVTRSSTQLIVELGAPTNVLASAPPSAANPVAVRPAHEPADSGRDVVVAIDAGHGGQDPGATGRGGTREKNVVLAIARALARRVNAQPGMRAVLTRNEDKFIALRDRINIARAARADIFVSIHADAIKNRDVTGSSVYVLSERGATSEAARWLAEQENAADLKGGVSLGDVDNQLASVLMDLSQTASIGTSMVVAERVLSHLDRVGDVRKSKVQQAGFVVLKSPDIPSMLVETAYISNPGEEKRLRSPSHQAAIAEAIFKGVHEYFRNSPPDGSLFARERDARRGDTAGR
jgi:N-acetylmuramoyl-L-alanine amidase